MYTVEKKMDEEYGMNCKERFLPNILVQPNFCNLHRLEALENFGFIEIHFPPYSGLLYFNNYDFFYLDDRECNYYELKNLNGKEFVKKIEEPSDFLILPID